MRIPYEASAPLGREFIELAPEVIAAILLTLFVGWGRARGFVDVNADAWEVPMTERLRDGMRGDLKTKGHPWGKMLIFRQWTSCKALDSSLLVQGISSEP